MLFDRFFKFYLEMVMALSGNEFKGLTMMSLSLSFIRIENYLYRNLQLLDGIRVFGVVRLFRI